MRTLIMTGKIGPKFDNNDITITDGVRQVVPAWLHETGPELDYRFITEHEASNPVDDLPIAPHFANGSQSVNTTYPASDVPQRNARTFGLLAMAITASDR